MAKIHVLPPQLSILVAAGEVVDRPRAVAKELLENAVDAGAKRITIESRRGGIEYLRVTDDGCGMTEEDARMAFLRHATSKITQESDLSAIGTLGFRGEALAAICAVSKVDLITRIEGAQMGVQVCLEGGQMIDSYETGCPKGTTITVRDLFYNLPARSKFVKSDQTESNHIEGVVAAAALSRPDIAMTYVRDGRQVFATQGDGKLLHAVYAVCGQLDGLLMAAGEHSNVQVSGFVSSGEGGRANRGMQYFFVNGRPIRSALLSSAVDQAYRGRIMSGRHPACFLNIGINLTAVDVNIHPAKAEVRFSNERAVFSAVYHCIISALDAEGEVEERVHPREDHVTDMQQQILVGPGYTLAESMPAPRVADSRMLVGYELTPPERRTEALDTAPQSPVSGGGRRAPDPTVYADEEEEPDQEQASAWPQGEAAELPHPPAEVCPVPVRVIGEAFQTYVLAQDEQGLWMIDKHAAHEKMLYDQLVNQTGAIPGQVLLLPQKVSLTPEEKDVILENLEAMEKAGFEVEDFGAGTLLVRQLPVYLEEKDMTYVLSDLARQWCYQKSGFNQVYDSLLKSIACRSAIKAGQESTVEELQRFCETLLNMPEVRNCPHGRPVATSLTRGDIEKMFRRRL